ncbi:MAG: tetratricopeptide repeat protein [Bacteroidales bacterium]
MKRIFNLTLCSVLFAFGAYAQTTNEAIEAYKEAVAKVTAHKTNEAVTAFERAISIANEVGDEANEVRKNAQDGVIRVWMKAAEEFFKKSDFDRALKKMVKAQTAATLYKDDKSLNRINRALPNLYFAMGNENLKNNLFVEAIYDYQKAIELNANVSKIHLALGAALVKIDSIDNALIAFDKTMEIAMRTNQPSDANEARKAAKNLLLKRGQEAKDNKQFADAYNNFNAAVKYDENDPDVRLQVTIAANNNSQWEDAITAGETALTLEKRDNMRAKIFYQLAYAFEQQGNTQKACENYKQVPASDSDKTNADGAIKRLKCQ